MSVTKFLGTLSLYIAQLLAYIKFTEENPGASYFMLHLYN